jgi:hypothetical protein
MWTDWSSVSDLVPTIVRHGYTPPPPPTPEPTLPCAVVRDAEGELWALLMSNAYVERWRKFGQFGYSPWAEMVQPVEIIFPGVPDV